MWTGTYHTSMEGSLRVPFIARWPGKIPASIVSNEIFHVVDIYSTLAAVAGVQVPQDRPIDGVNQVSFLKGETPNSAREGFVFFIIHPTAFLKAFDHAVGGWHTYLQAVGQFGEVHFPLSIGQVKERFEVIFFGRGSHQTG
jgi:arylsulfatase A-like enzyme